VLVDRSQSSDARFQRLFKEHHQAVLNYCHRRLPADDANDAASEVFAVAWRRMAKVPPEPATLPWLYGVARNVVRHSYRSRTRSRRLQLRLAGLGTTPAEPPDTQIVRHADEERLLQALEKLRPVDRELLRLKVWEELSHESIGQALGISAHAVDMRVFRALKRLRRTLAQRQTFPGHPRVAEKGGER
jgi:RNA polymerase sigma-70 factor (ECF subfamily)